MLDAGPDSLSEGAICPGHSKALAIFATPVAAASPQRDSSIHNYNVVQQR